MDSGAPLRQQTDQTGTLMPTNPAPTPLKHTTAL